MVVELLLEYGANVGGRSKWDGLRYTQQRARVTWESCSCCPAMVLMRTRDGEVARHLAACQEHLQAAEVLLKVARICVPGPIRT